VLLLRSVIAKKHQMLFNIIIINNESPRDKEIHIPRAFIDKKERMPLSLTGSLLRYIPAAGVSHRKDPP